MSAVTILKPKDLRELSRLYPWRSIARIFFEFSFIFALAAGHATGALSVWLLPLSLLAIGSRQHALLVLLHEGAHFRLSANRTLNEVLGSFIGWNFLASFHGYQRHHVKHHDLLKLNTNEDPDWARKQNEQWAFPMPKERFLKIIIRDLLLLNTGDYIQEAKDANNNKVVDRKDLYLQWGRVAYAVALLTVLISFGVFHLWLLFWILPLFTTLKAILRIRGVADHFCVKSDNPVARSRTVIGSGWDNLIFAPCSIAYHGVHHVYPSIPYYNLRRAHKLMMEDSKFAETATVSRNYWTALNECFSKQGASA